MAIKIGIVLGSTREGRVSESVGNWVLEKTNDFKETKKARIKVIMFKKI